MHDFDPTIILRLRTRGVPMEVRIALVDWFRGNHTPAQLEHLNLWFGGAMLKGKGK